MKKNSFVAISLSILSAVFIIASCSPDKEKNINLTNPENGEKTNLKVKQGKGGADEYEINSQDGKVTLSGKRGELPASFPKFIALYPGATDITSIDAQNSDAQQESFAMANFVSNDAATKIVDFYKLRLEPLGFTEKGRFNQGNMLMASFVNEKSEEALQITAARGQDDAATNIQLIYAKPKAK